MWETTKMNIGINSHFKINELGFIVQNVFAFGVRVFARVQGRACTLMVYMDAICTACTACIQIAHGGLISHCYSSSYNFKDLPPWLHVNTNNCLLLLRLRNAAVICFNLTESGIFISTPRLAKKQIENRTPNRRQSAWDIRLHREPQNKVHHCLKCKNEHIADLVWKQKKKESQIHAKTIISTETSSSPFSLSVNPIKVVLERRLYLRLTASLSLLTVFRHIPHTHNILESLGFLNN